MKKISLLMVLAMLISMIAALPAGAETISYSQAPMLDALVESGELPPVEERIPDNPRCSIDDYSEGVIEYEIGNYGGTLRTVTSSVNWDADVFVGMSENLLVIQDDGSAIIQANLVEEYTISEDATTYTFKLRKGLKWSSGVEVTMDDVKFAVEDYIFNEELTPKISAWMQVDGTPFEFTVIDDLHFELKFVGAYGTLGVYLSRVSFEGYDDFMKPAYYLKPYHKDYAEECHGSLDAYYEFIQPFATVMGYDDATEDSVWTYVFNQIDVNIWEVTDPSDCLTTQMFPGLIEEDFPLLTPWLLKSADGGITTWERNPYYHKVDPDGNQLPYIDYIESTLVEDAEMITLSMISGQVDFNREFASQSDVSLYLESADNANIAVHYFHAAAGNSDLYLNLNYGLNLDGTVKEDDYSKAWQEVINDVRFRRALALAIDGAEISDAVYNGLVTAKTGTYYSHDIDGANALLDEMGMLDVDEDGYRETPSGMDFQLQIWNSAERPDIIGAIELYTEFFREVGIHAVANTVESTLLSTSKSANEVPAVCSGAGYITYWYETEACDMGSWAPYYKLWYDAGCPDEAIEGVNFMIPEDEELKGIIKEMSVLSTKLPEEIVNVSRPYILGYIEDNCFIMRPLDVQVMLLIANKNLRNIPNGETLDKTAANYFMEDLFFKN